MILEQTNKLLEPDYLPLETGYCRLLNGQIFIAILTQMPGCKARWLDLWFNNSGETWFNNYSKILGIQLNLRKRYNSLINELKKSGQYSIGEEILKLKRVQIDPSKYFELEKLKASGFGMASCNELFVPGGNLKETAIILARDTYFGCEVKSRYWINNCTDEVAQWRLKHYIQKLNDLADFLKIAIEELKPKNKRHSVYCKFCFSDDVIKNGSRKNKQSWLCRNCGHGFINNLALPRMSYSLDTITKAAYNYYSGASLKDIRDMVENESHMAPSKTDIYRWIKRLHDITIKDVTHGSPELINSLANQ